MILADWRKDYNEVRPLQPLGCLSPDEYERCLSSGSPLRGSPLERQSTPMSAGQSRLNQPMSDPVGVQI